MSKGGRGRVSTVMLALILVLGLLTFLPAASRGGKDTDEGLAIRKETARTLVHAVAAGLGELLKGAKSPAEGVALVRAFIGPVRFYEDNSGYFYVYDYHCVNIAHATQKNLQGRDLTDHQDTRGKYVIRELGAAARQGGGFVEFYWAKPGSAGEFRKLGYVEPIPGTGYFLGTGVYLPSKKEEGKAQTIDPRLFEPRESKKKGPVEFALIGQVVSVGKTECELIVKLSDGDVSPHYIRVLYAPNGIGFDAPLMKENQMLPSEIFTKTDAKWLFVVYLPFYEEEKGRCEQILHRAYFNKEGKIVVEEAYARVPGRETEKVPALETLQCLIARTVTETHM